MISKFAGILMILSGISFVYADSKSELSTYLFQTTDTNTNATLIMKDGKIIYEAYARGFHKDSKHLAWSVTKTFVNALVGIAEKEGKLNRSDSICKYFTSLTFIWRDERCKIRIEDLLHMTSGLDWQEDYAADSGPAKSSVYQMLWGEGIYNGMGTYVLSHDVSEAPGEVWRYSTGDSTLLMDILRVIYGKESNDFPWTHLFDKIGIKNVTWERDSVGTFVGGALLYISARDLTRLGELYLNKGIWEGQELFPSDWVEWSKKIPNAFFKKRIGFDPGDLPGAHLWINLSPLPDRFPPFAPSAPSDLFVAEGIFGQSLIMIPSENLIAVRFADDPEKDVSAKIQGTTFSYNEYMKRVLTFVRESK